MDFFDRLPYFALGVISFGCLVAALFFLRFYRDSKDRLFLLFAAAFTLEAVNRTFLAFSENPREGDSVLYLLRAAAYALILFGIWDKNRSS